MPGGDGTGPAGMGPMTGRAAGYCVGYAMPGSVNPVVGRGFGGGGRGGRGRRNRFYATGLTGQQRVAMGVPAFGGAVPVAAPYAPTMSGEQQLDALKGQAEYFADVLNGIRKRIEELEAKGKND
ncbi:MAG: DUF5320 domain-containing protein [Phycisphaerae bacterium]|nr:DUF5320 domain-containing protein [Phycisphaerae bacterium]